MKNFFLYVYFTLAILAGECCIALAQVIPPRTDDNIIDEKIENIANTVDESVDLTELSEQLQHLLNNPIDLNRASREELLQSGLLSEVQINSILNHKEKTGKFISLYELQVLNFFSIEDINRILPYITLSPAEGLATTFKKIITEGNSRLLLRGQRYLETQEGFRDGTAANDTDAAYPGNAWRYYTQYQYRYKQKFSFNLTAEKDAGEDFFRGAQKNGFDFYSGHISIRDIGIVKTLVLGDYDLNYGQGLTLFTGLAFGKSPEVSSVRKIARGIKPYSSVNEVNFRRGGAVSFGFKKWTFDAFYSKRKLDAVLGSLDSLVQEDYFTSFYESGYHRTTSEVRGQNLIKETMVGGNVAYRNRNFQIGLTAVNIGYDIQFVKTRQLYSQFDFTGSSFSKVGVDYSYLFRNINFFGEFTRADNGSLAYVNGAIISLGSIASVSIVNRNYPRDFNYLYAVGFAESSTTRNEKGTYAGLSVKPNRYWALAGYMDQFTFPWLRFGVDAPSKGFEYLYQLTWTPSRQIELYFRGRKTQKQQNTSVETPVDYLINRTQDNYRFNVSYKISRSVTLKSRVEAVKVTYDDNTTQNGFIIYQDVIFKPLSFPLSGSVRYGIFDTDSYDSRLYTYENDILYSYSIPFFYNRGFRYYVTLRYKISRLADVWVRYAQTTYSNQNTFGSGLDEIRGNKRSEIKVQLRLLF